jgi:large subunit ribosomal protein L6
MSRIGKKPIKIPKNVTIDINDNQVKVKGPLGELSNRFPDGVEVVIQGQDLVVNRHSDVDSHRAAHGLTRALLSNMVTGVSDGFKKILLIVGTGYRVALQGDKLQIQVGYSHPVNVEPLPGIKFEVEGVTKMVVTGINKELVGQVAADIRAIRPPDVYKGKGIRYENEQLIKKAGKAGKK